jgi:hypothetical protein
VPLGRFEIKGPVAAQRQGRRQGPRDAGPGRADRRARGHDQCRQRLEFKDAPLVFVGYGVTAPERNWDDFKGQDLKGKLAVVLINDPDFETGKGDFGGKAMTYYGRWTYKFEEAARRGALGTLIVHETAPASYGWATVKNSNTNVMYDVVRKSRREPRAGGGLDPARRRRRPVQARRPGFRRPEAKAQSRDFKPVELTGVDSRPTTSRRSRGDHLEERDRRARGQPASGPVRRLQRPLGPSRHRPAGRQGRPHL